ncbi:MAG: cation:proton antiporter [Candidatus Nanohalobium sp.]
MVLASSWAQNFALIIITAAVLGALARKTKQPTVIAYIITGLLLGPFLLDVIEKTEATKLLGELGLSFLLFLIGLEIRLDEIKELLREVTMIALVQMTVSAALGYLTGMAFGFTTVESLFVAAAFTFSSTAVVVKLLSSKDEISTLPGKIGVGVLLIQDVAVVLLLALLSTNASTPGQILVSIAEIGVMISAIGGISYLSSKKLLPKIFNRVSENQQAFFIHGVAWAFLFITLSDTLGLSTEIGAFFAGLSLAQLPYRQELIEEIRPLTDFFMAVFFINIGLGLTGNALSAYFVEAFIAAGILMIGKFAILFGILDRLKFTPETSLKSALNLSQISEFSLILGALGVAKGLISQEIFGFISLAMIITVGFSSYFIVFSERIYEKIEYYLAKIDSEAKEDVDVETLEGHALIIGYDFIGRRSAEILDEAFDKVMVVDRNPGNVENLSESNYEYIYGDFSHGEIRNASQISKAGFVLSLIPDSSINRKIVEEAPAEATVFVKADSLEDAAELYDLGAHYVIQKNELSGEKMGEYLKLYLEDEELFYEEVKEDIERIDWGGRSV